MTSPTWPETATHYDPATGLFYRRLAGADWEFFINCAEGWSVSSDWQGRENAPESAVAAPSQWGPYTTAWAPGALPPVGTVCDRALSHSTWKATTICGHSTDGAYAAFYDGDGLMGWNDHCKFRPIRTAEQLAAEEREKQLADLADIVHKAFQAGEKISLAVYDAGYRK